MAKNSILLPCSLHVYCYPVAYMHVHVHVSRLSLGVARFSCLDGGEAYNERVITVGIGWVLLASATSGFSGYIKLAYCSSAKGAPVAQLVRASD